MKTTLLVFCMLIIVGCKENLKIVVQRDIDGDSIFRKGDGSQKRLYRYFYMPARHDHVPDTTYTVKYTTDNWGTAEELTSMKNYDSAVVFASKFKTMYDIKDYLIEIQEQAEIRNKIQKRISDSLSAIDRKNYIKQSITIIK